jgi:uncharacterized protein YkwD
MPIENRPILADSAYDLNFAGPSDFEQLQLELINRARANPAAEAARQSSSLGNGVSANPSEALAIVSWLDAAAQGHSDDMLAQNFFAHTNPFTQKSPFTRMKDAGYTYTAASENIGYIGSFSDAFTADRITAHHDNLWDSLSHRQAFMSAAYSEVGLGFAVGGYTSTNNSGRTTFYPNSSMMTQNFGERGLLHLTGVVFDDADGDQFYDIGEGQGDVRITAYNALGAWASSTWAAGGYTLTLDPGSYTVVFEGGDLDGYFATQVTISDRNVKLDVIEDRDVRDVVPSQDAPDPVDVPEPEDVPEQEYVPEPEDTPEPEDVPELADMASQGGAFVGRAGAEKVSLIGNSETVRGTLSALDGDEIYNFDANDTLILEGATLGAGAIQFNTSSGQLRIDNGASDATISLFGNFAGRDLLSYRDGGDVHIKSLDQVARLQESGKLSGAQVNGIIAPEYLRGGNSTDFNITFEAAAGAKYANTLGKYEINGSGAIVDVEIIAANVKTAGATRIDGVNSGNELHFFIIQNGFNKIAADVLASGNLGLSTAGGRIHLEDNGVDVADAVVFATHDVSLNPDGMEHAVSGLARDGSGAVVIGFEDLIRTSGSDDDFQDVAIRVEADYDIV